MHTGKTIYLFKSSSGNPDHVEIIKKKMFFTLIIFLTFVSQLRAMHEQLAALSQGPIIKPKKKKEKKDKKEKKKKKKVEKRSRGSRSRAGSEEWKMPGKILKTKSARAGVSQPKKSQAKKSNKNNKSVLHQNPASPFNHLGRGLSNVRPDCCIALQNMKIIENNSNFSASSH